MTVDMLDYAKKLEAAGVDRRQAEAHAQALKGAVETGLATKADVDAAAARLETGPIGRIEIRMTTLEGRFNLLTWMLAVNLTGTISVFWLLLRTVMK